MRNLIYILLISAVSCTSTPSALKVGQVWECEFKNLNKDPFRVQEKNVATVLQIKGDYVKYEIKYMIRDSKSDEWRIEMLRQDMPFITQDSEPISDFVSDYTLVKDVP